MYPGREKLNWIHNINSPEDLKRIPRKELPAVAEEYRRYLIECIAQTGGHLGASLGALELCLALHYVLDSPKDKICFDVGHQAYVHKMITGRRDRMKTIRQPGGLSGFPSPFESPHDPFIVAHAGTAISQALGLAVARDMKGDDFRVVAVVGDGALTSGLAYEALNNAGHMKHRMTIILNDNEMSIARNVGAISRYLNKVITNPLYNRIRNEFERQLDKFPRLRRMTAAGLESVKHLLVPGVLFEELGFRYFGPVDGHDMEGLVETLDKVSKLNECALIHVVTQKGKGYSFAEMDGERLHGVTPFDVNTGCKVKSSKEKAKKGISYTRAFVESLKRVAEDHADVVAITAAMPTGTGLAEFQKKFPKRFFDVGIAEQHAVTFAGALAKGGYKPVCAIYSTFLQRSMDNILIDAALQHLPLILCMDRAGLVGADGATHNGVFDISYLGHIPRIVIAAPLNEAEMEQMLRLAVDYPDVFAIRYPRGNIPEAFENLPAGDFPIGKGMILREGTDATILALGSLAATALEAHEMLLREGFSVRVVNARFVRPLDEELVLDSLRQSPFLFTLEEHVQTGGFGSKVLEFLERKEIQNACVTRFALPDEFIEHGAQDSLLDQYGLSPAKVTAKILEVLHNRQSLSSSQA